MDRARVTFSLLQNHHLLKISMRFKSQYTDLDGMQLFQPSQPKKQGEVEEELMERKTCKQGTCWRRRVFNFFTDLVKTKEE